MGVSQATNSATTVAPSAVHESPNWIEEAHGVESVAATVGLVIAAWWAWRGDFLKSRIERQQEKELRQREHQQRVETLEQREKQFRWDQAKLAREINEAFLTDPEVQVVLGVLDYDGGVFEAKDKDGGAVHRYDLDANEDVKALRIDGNVTDTKSVFLRDCFDAWFYQMSLMEQHLQIGLIRQEDIDYPTAYYIRRLKEDGDLFRACEMYIARYNLGPKVTAFLDRF